MYDTDICRNCLCAEVCEICGKYPVDECEYFESEADIVKAFGKFVIDKSVKGIIYAMDVPDFVIEFLEKKGEQK